MIMWGVFGMHAGQGMVSHAVALKRTQITSSVHALNMLKRLLQELTVTRCRLL